MRTRTTKRRDSRPLGCMTPADREFWRLASLEPDDEPPLRRETDPTEGSTRRVFGQVQLDRKGNRT